jgi:hypothetical protein
MRVASLVQLLQSLRQQVLPRWVLVALEAQGLVVQEWKPGGKRRPPAWALSWPEGLCDRGRPINIDALGGFLGDFLIEQGIVAAHALVALPPECSQWRVVEGLDANPGVWPQQLKAQEQALRLPMPLQNWQLNQRFLSDAASGPLLVAADRQAVDAWIDVFAQAGLTLDRLEPVQMCWMEALLPTLQQQGEQEALVLLHQANDAGVWMVVWFGLEPVYSDCLRGDPGEWMAVLEQRIQRLLAVRGAQGFRVVWDGPSDGLLVPRPRGWPPFQPAEWFDFGSLALLGLVRFELHEEQLDR